MGHDEEVSTRRTRWEYRTKFFWNSNDRERAAIEALLAEWGRESWELVTASSDADGYTYLIFKRPLV